jgi:unspecific peroxygenase
MRRFAPLLTVFVTLSAHLNHVFAFCPYASLSGLSNEQLAKIIPTLHIRPPAPPPGPPVDTSARLVPDANHPFIPPGPDDIRGPCPGLNTLANHGVSV